MNAGLGLGLAALLVAVVALVVASIAYTKHGHGNGSSGGCGGGGGKGGKRGHKRAHAITIEDLYPTGTTSTQVLPSPVAGNPSFPANAASVVTFNQTPLERNKIDYASDGTFTVHADGMFDVTFSAIAFAAPVPNGAIQAWVRVDGVDDPFFGFAAGVPTSIGGTIVQVLSLHATLPLFAGATFQIVVAHQFNGTVTLGGTISSGSPPITTPIPTLMSAVKVSDL